MEKLAARYGRGLYQLRINRGLSRQQVVDQNNISLNTLSSIENGTALIKLDTLQMLLDFYGLDMTRFTNQYINLAQLGTNTFSEQRLDPDARYFILDTKGATAENRYQDSDFMTYSWNSKQYNRVREGDWFIYRRPARASETKQWYLFGAGQIAHIRAQPDGGMRATIGNAMPFKRYLLADPDLEDFTWSFKTRTRNDWSHFFNMYGMNQINRQDFIGLLQLSRTNMDDNMLAEAGRAYTDISQGEYLVTESESMTRQRIGQTVLAERVKADYGYQCAVTGINTREFLFASHIVPWKTDAKKRLDPGNVICLSPLWDRAFDRGFITFDANDYRICLSQQIREDTNLMTLLTPYQDQRLHMPAHFKPEREALEYHNDVIFRQ
jgi:putative restriction endonuclease